MSGNFKSRVPQHLDDIERATEAALEMIGGIVESAAKEKLTENESVDTGLLRNSITHALGGEKAAISTYTADKGGKSGSYDVNAPNDKKGKRTVYVGSNVHYAPHVELGTVHSGAKPYLRPAVEESRNNIQKAITLAFKDIK